MHTETTFESMDWDAEAKRVQRAFGLEGKYEFRCSAHNPKVRFFLLENAPIPSKVQIKGIAGGRGFAFYGTQRFYGVARYSNGAAIWLHWNGEVWNVKHPYPVESADIRDVLVLARTLYHLALLTPEVEVHLRIAVTAHQKLEWTLEYEQRYGL